MAPAVALVRASGAAAGPDRLHRVALQQPVRHVDDVDVLLHDDVAGEGLVVDPVAETALRGRHVRPVGTVDGRREVVDLPRDGLADLALVDPLRELDVRRGVADLEAHRQAQLALRLLAERHHPLGPRHVHRDRLLEVDVLARGDGRLEVHRVEVGRRRDVEGVHVLAGEELLVRLRPAEEARRVDRGLPELRGHLVEPLLARLQVVLEHVPDRRQDGARVLQERAHDVAAPPPAAEQAEPDGRVGLRAPDEARLQDRDAGGGRATPTNSRRPTRVSFGSVISIFSSIRPRRAGVSLRAPGDRRFVPRPSSMNPVRF